MENKTQTKASGKTQNLDKDNKQKPPKKKKKIKTVEKLLELGHKEKSWDWPKTERWLLNGFTGPAVRSPNQRPQLPEGVTVGLEH